MQKLDIKELNKKHKPNPLFKGMSAYLKDPKNYEKIEGELINILQSDHNHKTASSYVKCKECQSKREERKQRMKDVGFKSIQQYMEWKKIMTIILRKENFLLR